MNCLLIFVGLQGCDLATTLWFLSIGIAEGNPLVSGVLHSGLPPAAALLALKGGACLLGWLAWRRGSLGLLRRLNLLFAACVAWNLLAIVQR
jgi:hypothetical protein